MTLDEAAYFMVFVREIIVAGKTDISEEIPALVRAELQIIRDMMPDVPPLDASEAVRRAYQLSCVEFAEDNYIVPIKQPYAGVGKATVKVFGNKTVAAAVPSVAPSPSKKGKSPAKKGKAAAK